MSKFPIPPPCHKYSKNIGVFFGSHEYVTTCTYEKNVLTQKRIPCQMHPPTPPHEGYNMPKLNMFKKEIYDKFRSVTYLKSLLHVSTFQITVTVILENQQVRTF